MTGLAPTRSDSHNPTTTRQPIFSFSLATPCLVRALKSWSQIDSRRLTPHAQQDQTCP